MKVLIPTPLYSYTQGPEVEASGATLAEVVADLERQFPGIRFRMIDEQDRMRPHIRFFVNRRIVKDRTIAHAVIDAYASATARERSPEVHLFLDMAPDGLHTIEAPPVGNCTLDEAFTLTQNRITLIGNIQYDEFRRLTPPQMRAAVHDVIREAAGRRLILSPTAGPFDPAPPGSLIANYLAFLDASCG